MKNIDGKVVSVGDFVIPFVSHGYRINESSLFGLVVSDNKVFTYNTTSDTYMYRDCTNCLKVSNKMFDADLKTIYNTLIVEYKKFQMEELKNKMGKPSALKIGQIYKKVNRNDKGGVPDYFIYLGNIQVTVFEKNNISHRIVQEGKRGYIFFSNEYVTRRATRFEQMLPCITGKSVDVEELLFNTFLCTDILNNYVFLKDVIYFTDRAILGAYVGAVELKDFKNSNCYTYDSTVLGKTKLEIELEGRNIDVMNNFILEIKLRK